MGEDLEAYAFDPYTGDIQWTAPTEPPIFEAPPVAIPSEPLAFDPYTGDIQWTAPTEPPISTVIAQAFAADPTLEDTYPMSAYTALPYTPSAPTFTPAIIPSSKTVLGLVEPKGKAIPRARPKPSAPPTPAKPGGKKVDDFLGSLLGKGLRAIPGLGSALNIADMAGMTLGALGMTGGARGRQGRLSGFGGRARGSVRRRRRVGLPRKMPTSVQWKRINKRLHEYRKVAIGVIGRTGGMHARRRHYPRRRWSNRRR